jgi:hypothetical protein
MRSYVVPEIVQLQATLTGKEKFQASKILKNYRYLD